VAIGLVVLQVTVAGWQLGYRALVLDGYGSLPMSWQMYSARP
jgi:hypothetical protein